MIQWASLFRQFDVCQVLIQIYASKVAHIQQPSEIASPLHGTLACLTESLDLLCQITGLSPTSNDVIFQFNQLLSVMNALILVVQGKVDLGLQMELIPDIEISQLNQLILESMSLTSELIVLFLEEIGFVEYDPYNPGWYQP